MTGLVTKKYGFMPRVTILCHSKEELGFYIYIRLLESSHKGNPSGMESWLVTPNSSHGRNKKKKITTKNASIRHMFTVAVIVATCLDDNVAGCI
jgi:hypothetical protein